MRHYARFGRASDTEWRLDVSGQRLDRLHHGPDYESIVSTVAASMQIELETDSMVNLGSRAILRVAVCPELVDLFHNSASGYRAQYYFSPKEGDRANRYALEAMIPRLRQACRSHHSWRMIEASLAHPQAKIWIHQGLWHRRIPKLMRNLHVARWDANAPLFRPEKPRARFWASLTPDQEHRLVIKGGFVTHDFNTAMNPKKEERSQELHDFGFS